MRLTVAIATSGTEGTKGRGGTSRAQGCSHPADLSMERLRSEGGGSI